MAELLPGEKLYPDLERGTRVIWLRENRGGYGEITRFPATVLNMTKRGRVRLQLDAGRQVTVTRRSVRADGGAP